MRWEQYNATLIASRKREYLQAMLLTPQLVTREQIKQFRYDSAAANAPSTLPRAVAQIQHNQHVKHYYHCKQQRLGCDYPFQFNQHIICEWKCEKISRQIEAKQQAQQCAWDTSFEDLADDFFPLEKYGEVYYEAEPWTTQHHFSSYVPAWRITNPQNYEINRTKMS